MVRQVRDFAAGRRSRFAGLDKAALLKCIQASGGGCLWAFCADALMLLRLGIMACTA